MAARKGGSQRNKQGRAAERGKKMRAQSSKKEKLLGQELGKTGRAAERGKPVTDAQKGLGNYSRQTMQNKKMRDMPVKQKVQEMGLQLGVAALTSPGTLRGVSNKVGQIRSNKYEYVVHTTDAKISGNKINPGYGPKTQQRDATLKSLGSKPIGPATYVTPVKKDWEIPAYGNTAYYGKVKKADLVEPPLALQGERYTKKPVKILGKVEGARTNKSFESQLRSAVEKEKTRIVPKIRRK
jgi:hypothetical protein